jgi:tRNA(Ile)-lysidine synthase
MNLPSKVDQLILEEKLADKANDRILIAMSGGIDSCCLFHVLYHLGYSVGIAHVNHQLREKQADDDELFVGRIAAQFNVAFYTKSIDIKSLAKAKKTNMHQCARDVRYLFFEEICQREGFTKIATAHHLDDQIESFLFNFTRGSGIRGLSGIPVKRDNIIRPLINTSKHEINAYIISHQIAFREDESNDKLDYKRNFIRHKIIPLFENVHPGFSSNAGHSLDIMRQSRAFYEEQMEKFYAQFVHQIGMTYRIEQSGLHSEPNGKIILYEILQKFNFNKDQLDQIYPNKAGNGQLFHSPTHTLLIDRDQWIIRENKERSAEEYFIPAEGIDIPNIGQFKIDITSSKPMDLRTKYTAFMDADKLAFPLKVRYWKAGDYFYPLNMGGKRQKLKNYFVNEKLNRFEKEEVHIVESAGEIIWLIGHRMDDRFKLTETTGTFCCIEFVPAAE